MTTKIKSGLIADNAIVSAHISSGAISSAHLSSIDTDNVSEGSSNLYFTTARARTSLSVTDSGGDGSLAYDNSTGAITYTGPSASEVQAHFSAGTNTTYSTGQFSISDSTIRSKFSVTDSGGDGSLSYSNGVITYTGPSASEVRAHLSAGTGVTYSSGAISIGQSVATTASPTFADINITGNINVTGDLNTVSVTDLDVTDKTITLGAGQNEASSGGSGIVVDGSGASLLWDESNDEFDFNKGINVTGNLHAGDGTDINMDGSSNGQLEVDGDGYTGAIALNGSAMHIYHNSSSRDLVLGTNEIARLSISGTGGFNFESNPVQGITTLSSGAITSTGILTLDTSPASNGVGDLQIIPSGNATQGVGFAGQVFGVNISSSLSSNSPKQANTWGGVTGATAIALQADDNTYGQFQVWTSPQDSSANTVLTPRFWIAGNGNATFAGTITSGAITSSASITASGNSNNFGNTTISNLSATAVTTSGSITASGNSNSFGNTTLGTISSGAITSTGTVTVAQNILSASSAPLVLTGDSGANIELYGNGTAFIDATTTSFRGTNGSGTGNISAGTISSGALTATEVNISNGDLNFTKVDGIGINAKESLAITIDSDNNDSSRVFSILDGSGSTLMQVTDTGNATFLGNVVASESVTSVGGVVNTNTGSNPFYITRQGATDQALKIYTDDAGAVFESIQDESLDNYGNFIFAMDGGTTEPFFDVRKGTASSGSKFRVDGSGNVGIGNDAPLGKLHVRDGSAQSGISHTYIYDASAISIEATEPSLQLMAEDSGTHGGSLLWRYGNNAFAAIANPTTDAIDFTYGVSTANDFQVHSGTNMSSYKKIMSIGGDGNVGVGNDAPAHRLHIQGATTDEARVRVSNSSTGQASLDLNNTEGYFRTYTDSGEYMIYDQTDGEERLRIDTSGNVGIGTTNPAFKLVVSHNGRNGMEFVPNTNDTGTNIIQNYNRGTAAYTPLRIAGNSLTLLSGTNAQHSTFIDSSGNVGIGVAPSVGKLHVAGNIYSTGSVQGGSALIGTSNSLATFGSNNSSTGISISRDGNASSYPDIVVHGTGKVGIGTNSPTEKLTVNGALAVTGALVDDRTSTGTMDYISGYTRFVAYGASGETGAFSFNTAQGGSSSAQKVVINTTGQIQATSGVVSSPTFSFIGDTNTGMTRPTSDTLQFITGGIERLRLGNGQMLVNGASTAFNAGKSIVYGGSGTGQNGGTVHYNGPSREYRNVVSVHTAIGNNRYWHIKTNFFSTNNIMFVARVHGYSYGNSGHIVDIQRSGYAYAAHGQLTGSQSVNNGSGADTLEVYWSSDNYVCFRHSTPASGYYSGYSFDIKMNSPTGYNWNFEVLGHAINSTSGNHY
jgi:hypothetical protein